MSPYENMIVSSPRTSQMRRFFAVSTFSVFELPIARSKAINAIERIAIGAAKYIRAPATIWRTRIRVSVPGSSAPYWSSVKLKSRGVLSGIKVFGI